MIALRYRQLFRFSLVILAGLPEAAAMSIAAPLPSNRRFGSSFCLVFGVLAIYLWWRGAAVYPLAAVIAALFLTLTVATPKLLRPLNRGWGMLSDLLQRVASTVVLAVLFFFVFTPVALLMRLFNRDTMRRRFDPDAVSYWIPRDPPGPPPQSLREQG